MALEGKLRIVAGPSKWDLMSALFDPKHHGVSFMYKSPADPSGFERTWVKVESLTRRDQNGEMFFFDGLPSTGVWVTGAFSAKTREGWLRFGDASRGWSDFAEDLVE